MPPPPAGGVTGARPGELLDRFVARLIDHILLAVVNGIITAVLVVGILGMDAAGFGGFSTGASFVAGAVTAVIGVALQLAYFGFLDTTQGRTLGKMVMKLRVVGATGGNPTWEESLKRNSWIALGLLGIIPLIGILGSLASLVLVIVIAVQINNDTAQRKPWTDNFAGTQVLKEG